MKKELKGDYKFFIKEANHDNKSKGYGLIRDKSKLAPEIASIASVGYGFAALVIGVEKLSKVLDKNDINTAILLGDGAGATIGTKAKNKLYDKNIESIGKYGDLLTCKEKSKIYMDGKKVYKFATTKVSENIKKLLEKQKLKTHDIKLIIPHQSNVKIIESIAEKIGALPEQIYINLDHIGNTFNASIPIAIDEVINKKLLKDNDKIILAGYGGGLNLGSILIEI